MILKMSDYAKMTEEEREAALAKLTAWARCPKECVDEHRNALDFIEAQEWAGNERIDGVREQCCLDCGAEKGQEHSTDCWWLACMKAGGRR